MVDFLERQRAMLAAINASKPQLRRDECSDWRITGTQGYIYVDGDGFLLGVRCRSTRGWKAAKKHLAFCRLTQDGDDEGCLHLDHLPDADEASTIRAVLGIRKRRDMTPESLAHLASVRTPFQPKNRENE
jgi:hypothetical protein